LASSKKSVVDIAVSSKALLTSNPVTHRLTQNKTPRTIAETVILHVAIDLVQTMFGEKCPQQLRNIPLSDNTVSRQIANISEDLEEQLIEKLRNKCFQYRLMKRLIVAVLVT
jgi:hypothetical protein